MESGTEIVPAEQAEPAVPARPARRQELTQRQILTAAGLYRGLSITEAMRQAGYAEDTARTHQRRVLRKLRAEGLAPDPALLQRVTRVYYDSIQEAQDRMSEALPEVVDAMLNAAKAGDVKAAREILQRTMGPVSTKTTIPVQQLQNLLAAMVADVDEVVDDPVVRDRLLDRWEARFMALSGRRENL